MSSLPNTLISMAECPFTFSFDELKDTPEVDRFLASAEVKSKMSFAQLFVPDRASILGLVGFLPFYLVWLLVSTSDVESDNRLMFK